MGQIVTYLLMVQKFTNLKRKILKLNIKTRAYYFCNDIIERENFDSSLLKIDKKTI